MNQELKMMVLLLLEELKKGTYNASLAADIEKGLNRKRGRQPGTKYPRKTGDGGTIFMEKDNGFIESPMLGRKFDVSMLIS